MSEPQPGADNGAIPAPRNFKEFEVWVERLNNQLARKHELEAARDKAVEAVIKSHEPGLAPHVADAELLLAGVKR